MDILLDIVHSVDYGVLAYISEHWRGGLSDTVWKVFSLLGSYGAVWITLAVLLLFFRRTRRAGAAMLIALGVGFLLGNVFLKNLVLRPRPFVTHTDLTALLVPERPVVVPVRAHAQSSFAAAAALQLLPPQERRGWPMHCGGGHRVLAAVRLRPLPDRRTGRCGHRRAVRHHRCMADRPRYRPVPHTRLRKGKK